MSQQPANSKLDKQRRLAPVFFTLAVIITGLGIAQAVKGISWLAVISDFVMAAVLVALGLRVLKPLLDPRADAMTVSTPPDYAALVRDLQGQYSALLPGEPVRLAKRTSNLFRTRSESGVPGLDVTAFDGVLSVDPEGRTADVLGMKT